MSEIMQKEFEAFKEAVGILDGLKVRYVVFGGIAVWAYGRRRETKDIDLLIDPADADKALVGLLKGGWTTRRTDEKWLYQATKDSVLVDLIFQAKGNFVLSKEILNRAVYVDILGHNFRVVLPEDLIIIKIYALKEIRPADWYDAISVLKGVGGKLDWQYIIDKAKRNPKRILSFFLFAQTEAPAEFVPSWVLEELMDLSLGKAA